MAVRSGSALTSTAILCAIVLACGVACSVLLFKSIHIAEKFVVHSLEETLKTAISGEDEETMDHMFSHYEGPVWLVGLVYAIPGFIGLIGCCMKSKCMMVFHMVCSILSLIVMALVFVGCIIFIGSTAQNGGMKCIDVAGQCVCSNLNSLASGNMNIGFGECDAFNKLYAYLIGLAVVICLAWILELVSTITSGKYACCSPEVSHPGVIIQHVPVAGHVHMSSVVGDGHVGSDRAVLVQNMQY